MRTGRVSRLGGKLAAQAGRPAPLALRFRDNILTHGVTAHRPIALSPRGAHILVLSRDRGSRPQRVAVAKGDVAGLAGGQQPYQRGDIDSAPLPRRDLEHRSSRLDRGTV